MNEARLLEEIERLRERVERHEKRIEGVSWELEILKQISTDNLIAVLELRKSMEALSQEFRSFKDEMRAFKDEMRAFKDEMRAFKDEMNRKWGDLANRLGTLTEDIFAPGLPYLAERLGFKVKKRMLDVEYQKDGRYNQYDAIVLAEDEGGREVLFVAEVKSQLRAEHFDEFRAKLENLFHYEPEWREKPLVPILAALRIPQDLVAPASRRGVLLVRMGGDYLEALNPEVLPGSGGTEG